MKVFKEPEVPTDQLLLLPPNVEDFVPMDAPVRVLSEIVDLLDCSSLQEAYPGGGAPAYDPIVLFKGLVFGDSQGVRSSRQLARAFEHDLRFMYLARMSKPSYRTICRFRCANQKAIEELFLQTVLFARRLKLALLDHVSVDGTKLDAAGSKRQYFTTESVEAGLAKLAEKIAQIMANMAANDAREDLEYGEGPDDGIPDALRNLLERKARLEQAKAEMEARGLGAIILTDPDSRMMKTNAGPRPAFNAQAVVDAQAQIIVAADVTLDAADAHQLRPMLEQVEKTLGEMPDQVTADGGYWSKDSLDFVEERNVDAYIAPGGCTENTLEGWTYDASADTYTSPDGDIYRFSCIRTSHGRASRVYHCRRTRKQKWVAVDAAQIIRMREKVRSVEGRAIYRLRQIIVEPVFGHIKGAFGLRKLLMRGLSGARFEYLLACITHNLGKIMQSWPAGGSWQAA